MVLERACALSAAEVFWLAAEPRAEKNSRFRMRGRERDLEKRDKSFLRISPLSKGGFLVYNQGRLEKPEKLKMIKMPEMLID